MLFISFARVCEAIGATTKKLQKAAFLQAFFEQLSDNDLQLAARFFAGRPFSFADPRVLNVGGTVVRDAVLQLTGATVERWNQLVVELGEAGRAARGAVSSTPRLGRCCTSKSSSSSGHTSSPV